MHRTRLAEKARAEMREHLLGTQQHAPEPLRILAVVGGVRAVVGERHGAGDLVRHLVDAHLNTELAQGHHHIGVEFRDRHRPQHELADMAVAGAKPQHVVDKIELNGESAAIRGNRRRAEPAGGDMEGDVPRVVEPRCQRQPHLADHLRPQMQRFAGVLPCGERQVGPAGGIGWRRHDGLRTDRYQRNPAREHR
jgi:hypothetical protein